MKNGEYEAMSLTFLLTILDVDCLRPSIPQEIELLGAQLKTVVESDGVVHTIRFKTLSDF